MIPEFPHWRDFTHVSPNLSNNLDHLSMEKRKLVLEKYPFQLLKDIRRDQHDYSKHLYLASGQFEATEGGSESEQEIRDFRSPMKSFAPNLARNGPRSVQICQKIGFLEMSVEPECDVSEPPSDVPEPDLCPMRRVSSKLEPMEAIEPEIEMEFKSSKNVILPFSEPSFGPKLAKKSFGEAQGSSESSQLLTIGLKEYFNLGEPLEENSPPKASMAIYESFGPPGQHPGQEKPQNQRIEGLKEDFRKGDSSSKMLAIDLSEYISVPESGKEPTDAL